MGQLINNEIKLEIILKNGETITESIEYTSSGNDEWEWMKGYRILYAPYDFATCANPEELANMIKRGFIEISYSSYGREYNNYLFFEGCELWEKITEIPSMSNIKSISIYVQANYEFVGSAEPFYSLQHTMDLENVKYQICRNGDGDEVSIITEFHGCSYGGKRNIGAAGEVYSYKTHSLICPNCGRVVDKENFYIDSEEHKIYCHKDCRPGSIYSAFRSGTGTCCGIYELVKTSTVKRTENIEKIFPGDKVSFVSQDTENGKTVEIFCGNKSIGFIAKADCKRFLYYPESGCDDIEYELSIKNVIPLSKLKKGERKPSVTILQNVKLKNS